MAMRYNAAPPSGMCFCFDGLNPRCYSGSGTTFKELVSQATATASVSSPGTLGIVNNHLRFTNPTPGTRVAYIPFASADITVPTGQQGSWSWFQYFEDQGNVDHPNIGKETTGTWSGTNGFVFGTGWGTDGPRWGIGGTQYTLYTSTPTDYVPNIWQCWTVTYNGGSGNNANGLKTYLNGELLNQTTAVAATIGSNSNDLHVGATNSRSGNWGGYMDIVQMWDRELTAEEVYYNFTAFRGRFGL